MSRHQTNHSSSQGFFSTDLQELGILPSSSDASKNRDLRVAIREKLIDFIVKNHPGAFVKIRIQNFSNRIS
jgi:hypothetical protein